MSNTTNTPSLPQLTASNEPISTSQTMLAITESDQTKFLSALYAVMYPDTKSVKSFFESQPIAIASLGIRYQHSKDDGERMAINSFINSLCSLNMLILNIMQRQSSYNDLEALICSLPTIDEPTE